MQRPTAVPRMPASASGVSTQRSAPKRSRNPAVARKTPPARPTSSPSTSTESSRASSTWKQSFTASTMLSSAKDPLQLLEIGSKRCRRVDECVLEEQCRIGGRLCLRSGDRLSHQLGRPRLDLFGPHVVEHARTPEIALVAPDALVLLLLLDTLKVYVRLRIVGGRMRCSAVRHRLDEGRPAAVARTRDGITCRLVDRKDVGAVDAYAGNAVADRLVGECLRARLRSDRRR